MTGSQPPKQALPARTSPASPPRPRGRPAGRTTADGVIADREVLLNAAENLIREKGPSVSLKAIANRAGVTKPTLYRGVGDRDALVKALAERMSLRVAESITGLAATAATPREALRSLVGGYLEIADQDRHLYLFITAGGGRDDRVEQSLLLADGAVQYFAEGMAAFRAAQGADPAVATVWSYGLLGALHFVTLWWLREQSSHIDLVADQITALLWSGMGSD